MSEYALVMLVYFSLQHQNENDMNQTNDSTSDDPLNQILAEYLQAVEAGQPPDEEKLIAQHPEFADQVALPVGPMILPTLWLTASLPTGTPCRCVAAGCWRESRCGE